MSARSPSVPWAPGCGDTHVAGLSPLCRVTLDTPVNRKSMPEADFSSWTPLEFLVE